MSGYKINNGNINDLTFLQIASIIAMNNCIWEFKSSKKAILTVG